MLGSDPALHGGEELLGERTVAGEEIEVGLLGVIEAIDREIRFVEALGGRLLIDDQIPYEGATYILAIFKEAFIEFPVSRRKALNSICYIRRLRSIKAS